MKIADALRDRARLAELLDPAGRVFVEGDEESRQQARRQWHAHRFAGQVMSSSLEELQRGDLSFGRFGSAVHVPSGRIFRLRKDQIPDIEFTNATSFFCGVDGVPQLPRGA